MTLKKWLLFTLAFQMISAPAMAAVTLQRARSAETFKNGDTRFLFYYVKDDKKHFLSKKTVGAFELNKFAEALNSEVNAKNFLIGLANEQTATARQYRWGRTWVATSGGVLLGVGLFIAITGFLPAGVAGATTGVTAGSFTTFSNMMGSMIAGAAGTGAGTYAIADGEGQILFDPVALQSDIEKILYKINWLEVLRSDSNQWAVDESNLKTVTDLLNEVRLWSQSVTIPQ